LKKLTIKMLAALFGLGLVDAAQVVLLDNRSGNYFNADSSAKTDLAVADLVSRTFNLRPLTDQDTSVLKQTRQTPTDNVMVSLYGVDAASLPSLQGYSVSPLQGGKTRYSSSLLAAALHETVPEATSISTGRALHKETAVLSGDDDNVFDVELDTTDPRVSAFLREVSLCKKALDSLGSATNEKPQMSFLQITTLPALTEPQQKVALKAVDQLLEHTMKMMPENSIGEVLFHDMLDLGALRLERESKSLRRRLQDGNGSNSTNSTNSTGQLTYMVMYTNQMFYWTLTAGALIVYFFSYCFAIMVYDNDKMLYTTFNANMDGKKDRGMMG